MLFQNKETIKVKTIDWWDNIVDLEHIVRVDWHSQGNLWWNETCALVLEVFGLPGQKYYYKPDSDYMTFTFKNKRDADLCRILLSERL